MTRLTYKQCKAYPDSFSYDIDAIKEQFAEDCVAIFLGAGSSMDAVDDVLLPDWQNLLSIMLNGIHHRDQKPKPNEYLDVAGQIEEEVQKRTIENIQQRMEEKGLLYPELVSRSIAQPIVKSAMAEYVHLVLVKGVKIPAKPQLKEDSTLCALADACVHRVKNRKRTIIISYNFDDFLEYFLRINNEISPKDIHVTSYRSSNTDLQKAVRAMIKQDAPLIQFVYVHGRIPLLSQQMEIEKTIVLSQQSYDYLFRTSATFSNQVQYFVMASMPCISIGFSGDDVNFRRLRKELAFANCDLPDFYVLKYCSRKTCKCGEGVKSIRHSIYAACKALEFNRMKPIVACDKNYGKLVRKLLIKGTV